MKKYLKIIIPVVVVAIIAVLGYQVMQKTHQQKVKTEALQTIPNFTFEDINKGSLNKNIPTIFIHFNSGCEHCQYEAQELYKFKDKLNNCQIFMISDEPKEKLEGFKTRYKLSEISNLRVLQGSFEKYFINSTIPDIFIYDAEGNLKKRFKGETKIEALLKVLEK